MTNILFALKLVSCVIIVFAFSSAVHAGEILSIGESEQCEFSYSGEIQTGDLAKIKSAHDTHFRPYEDESGGEGADTRSICLDSVGGALQEAIAIGNYIYNRGIGTRISAADQCLSACAFIFMMGVARGGEEAFVNRIMHSSAKLGFHRPSIDLPSLSGLTEKELESAFDGAIEITSNLVELTIRQIPETQRPMMKADLISEAFRRKGQDFFYIDTVNKAGRWEIGVAKVTTKLDNLNTQIAQNVCFNLLTWTSKNHSDRGVPNEQFGLEDVNILQGKSGQISYAWGQGGVSYSDGFCSVALHKKYGSPTIVVCSDGTGPLARFTGRNCSDPEKLLSPIEYLPLDLAAYPPDQPLTLLPNFDLSKLASSSNKNRRKIRCLVISDGKTVDDETCFREQRQTSDGGELEVFVWPSGGKTVIQTSFGGAQISINGNKAQGVELDNYGYCYLNSRSGNYFCTK